MHSNNNTPLIINVLNISQASIKRGILNMFFYYNTNSIKNI